MKVAIIRQKYTAFGGAERFVDGALLALAKEGTSLTLVTRRWRAALPFDVQVCNPPYIGRLWRDWSFDRAVCRHVASAGYAVVQSHERVPCCSVYRAGDGVHREWLMQRERILSPHGCLLQRLSPYHRYTLAAERRLFTNPRLQAVICISRMVRDDIRRHFSVPEHKLKILYNGVDTERFHPGLRHDHRHGMRKTWGVPADVTALLFVGSGYARKGLPILLRALTRLPETIHLWIVGKDRSTTRYRRKARTLGLRDRAHFAGPQTDVRPFYAAADAFVLPALYEPFGNVVLEAMASGLPVVVSANTGAADIVSDGQNGFVCEVLDLDGLVRCLDEITKPERCRSMGEQARATAASMTIERNTEALLSLYRTILRESPPNPPPVLHTS